MIFQGIHNPKKTAVKKAVLALVAAAVVLLFGWFAFGENWYMRAAQTRELDRLAQRADIADGVARVRQLNDALTLDPKDTELLISLGNNWKGIADFTKDERHYRNAADAYERAFAASEDKNSLASENAGTAYTFILDYAHAERWYRLAIEKNPGEVDYYTNLIDLLRQSGAASDKVIDVYRAGLEQLVDNASLIQSLAEYLRDSGRYKDALTYYRLLAAKYPGLEERLAEMEAKVAAEGQSSTTATP